MRALSNRPLVAALALFSTIAGSQVVGCSSNDAGEIDGVAAHTASGNPVVDLGSAVAQHPLFAPLSARVDGQLAALSLATHGKSQAQISALLVQLKACIEGPMLPSCTQLLASMGTTPAILALNAEQAQEIAADVGLDEASPTVAVASLRYAHEVASGWGASNDAVATILAGGAVSCDASCAQTVGNALGDGKADYLARITTQDQQASDNDTSGPSGGGSGGGAAEAAVWVEIAIDAITILEDLLWNSNEEDKACESDDDCNDNQFCHTLGDNDCRSDYPEGRLCQRDNECLSDCCKIWSGSGFLPSCRPASKCD